MSKVINYVIALLKNNKKISKMITRMHMELNVQQTMEILLIFRIIGLLIVKIYLSLLF